MCIVTNRTIVHLLIDGTISAIGPPYSEPAYLAAASMNAEFDTHLFRYTYQSPITAPSTFDYDVDKGTSLLLKQQVVPNYDKALYTVERFMMPAKDGVKVPLT